MRPDEILLLDMLLAAREGVEFLRRSSLEEFEGDRMRQLASAGVVIHAAEDESFAYTEEAY